MQATAVGEIISTASCLAAFSSIQGERECMRKGGEWDIADKYLLCIDDVQISGKFSVDGSGNVNFKEEDGIDYAPVTVQLPGGERVPFLFTIKELNAKGSLGGFGGDFTVPSYRGSSFLDPKVRHVAAPCTLSYLIMLFCVA